MAATERLDALLDAAVDAIVLINPEGRITRFNRAAERIFGYAAADVVGHNVNILMPAPYHAEHDGYVQRFLSTGEARIIGIGREVTACRRDGSTFPIDLSVGEFRSGAEHGFVGILRDISERKRQQMRLQQTAERLRLLFDNAPTPIIVTGAEGTVLDLNTACQKLLGYPPKALLGRPLAELVAGENRDTLQRRLQGLTRTDDTCQCELQLRRADGELLPVELFAGRTFDREGRPDLYIQEIFDRSELLAATREAGELRDRLAHAARVGMLGEMVSGIAHEVNQPLAAISTYASACRRLLLSRQADPQELAEVLEKISRQAERAGQVIRGLRSMIRRHESERQELDVNALVEDVSRLVEVDLRGAAQRLELLLDGGLPSVVGDAVQIQQVVLNLIRNGLEAMRESGTGERVRVCTSRPGEGRVEICVSDDGPGLAAEVEARLFDPFVTTKSRGMGLGLSICKSIVHAHGGELLHRRPDGGGTEFVVRLPTTEGEEA